jgi:hypothetical protein
MHMTVTDVSRFERFFRQAAGLDVDKNDLKRHDDFVDDRLYDLMLRGEANAKANNRDIIEFWDLPITKGLQERMREFDKVEEAEEIRRLLAQDLRRPPSDVTFAEETEELLPEVFGGLSIALARSFKIIDPELVNPATEHWERAFGLFRLVF